MTDQPISNLVDTMAREHTDLSAEHGAASAIATEAMGRAQLDAADNIPGKRRVDRAAAQFIAARVGGADLRLQIVPDDLRIYAAAIEPPFAAMSKLAGDDWAPDLVERTLQFAAIPAEDRERMAKFARYGIATQYGSMPKNVTITNALATRPMAQYSKLAALCLMAALLGIPDDEAHFSDGTADGA